VRYFKDSVSKLQAMNPDVIGYIYIADFANFFVATPYRHYMLKRDVV